MESIYSYLHHINVLDDIDEPTTPFTDECIISKGKMISIEKINDTNEIYKIQNTECVCCMWQQIIRSKYLLISLIQLMLICPCIAHTVHSTQRLLVHYSLKMIVKNDL